MAPKTDNTQPRTSRVGKRPVELPKGVSATVDSLSVKVQGPKGSLLRTLPGQVVVKQEGNELRVTSDAVGRDAPRLQGLVRALLASMVKGVTEGYERRLEMHGTGYRVEQRGDSLHFSLGFSHPVDFKLPVGLTATVPPESKGTLLVLQGTDKEVIGQAAATIRAFRPPEPYRGKGVRYQGERVREKAGKAGK